MHKPLIGAAVITAICLTGHLLHRAEGDEKGKEPANGKAAEPANVQTAKRFRDLTRATYEPYLMKGVFTEAETRRLHEIVRMVHYAEMTYRLAAPQQPDEPPIADLAKHFRTDAESAEREIWIARMHARIRDAVPVSQRELQQMALKAELLRSRAEEVSTLPGKSQLDRIEWKLDVLSQELWFLIDRLSKAEIPEEPGRR